ncbi:hypothetical protein BWD14_08515 [Leptospira santarosai]|uniref:Uncharacterized protein n=1 Tax=Leptospira santarosai TaxID=28183 RepID=A0AB73MAV2_9LEPT|nr:hypothetical protein BWD14_08515 [Leptospira santarosai]
MPTYHCYFTSRFFFFRKSEIVGFLLFRLNKVRNLNVPEIRYNQNTKKLQTMKFDFPIESTDETKEVVLKPSHVGTLTEIFRKKLFEIVKRI